MLLTLLIAVQQCHPDGKGMIGSSSLSCHRFKVHLMMGDTHLGVVAENPSSLRHTRHESDDLGI